MIKIEKNIPVPESIREKYPLPEMEIGDSFVVKKEKRNSVLTSARHVGIKVTTRSIGDGKVRVWRIK